MTLLGRLPGLLLPALADGAQRAAVSEFPAPMEQHPSRDAALLAMLPLVETLGWSLRALRQAAGPDADLLFPGGPAEMVEAHADLGDRRMAEAAGTIAETRVSARVRALILLRLEQAAGEREAIRRGLALLSLPGNRLAALRSVARTVDAIWHAAGDASADMSWYSKRAILTGVYSATLLFWLRDESDGSDTQAFLDRRLASVARFGRRSAALKERAGYAFNLAATWSGAMRTRAS
ncbi:COQ9 family protein [Lichenicoccus sp.]|uniref:COQ9 family protein n=1 Tax=Lichenicoccus sp. TaxID=2781899 RepID=UPI003D122682